MNSYLLRFFWCQFSLGFMAVHQVSANATEKRRALQARRLESLFIAFVARNSHRRRPRSRSYEHSSPACVYERTCSFAQLLETSRRQWAISSENRVTFGWCQNVMTQNFGVGLRVVFDAHAAHQLVIKQLPPIRLMCRTVMLSK